MLNATRAALLVSSVACLGTAVRSALVTARFTRALMSVDFVGVRLAMWLFSVQVAAASAVHSV